MRVILCSNSNFQARSQGIPDKNRDPKMGIKKRAVLPPAMLQQSCHRPGQAVSGEQSKIKLAAYLLASYVSYIRRDCPCSVEWDSATA